MYKVKTKIYIAAIVFLLTFAFGISISFLTLQNTVLITPPTSLCAAIKNNHIQLTSEGKANVHLKGYLSGDEDFLGFSDVNRHDCDDSYATIVLADGGKLSVETQNILQKMSRLTDENNLARVEVEVIGTLEEQILRGLLSSRFLISAIQIKPEGSIQVISHSTLAKEAKESR